MKKKKKRKYNTRIIYDNNNRAINIYKAVSESFWLILQNKKNIFLGYEQFNVAVFDVSKNDNLFL